MINPKTILLLPLLLVGCTGVQNDNDIIQQAQTPEQEMKQRISDSKLSKAEKDEICKDYAPDMLREIHEKGGGQITNISYSPTLDTCVYRVFRNNKEVFYDFETKQEMWPDGFGTKQDSK